MAVIFNAPKQIIIKSTCHLEIRSILIILLAHSYCKELVMKPRKLQRKKQRSKDLCWKFHDRAHLLFCAHTLKLNYVTVTFLLVSSTGTNNDLLWFVHRHGQKSDQKHRTKNFARLHDHLHLLTMVCHFIPWDDWTFMEIFEMMIAECASYFVEVMSLDMFVLYDVSGCDHLIS